MVASDHTVEQCSHALIEGKSIPARGVNFFMYVLRDGLAWRLLAVETIYALERHRLRV